MKAFLICPVRGHSMAETEAVVEALEAEHWTVHWPPRDTDQTDATGLRICSDNRAAIADAYKVFIIWNGESQGCLFDMGMAFALHKPIVIISIPTPPAEGKGFSRMLAEWAERGPSGDE